LSFVENPLSHHLTPFYEIILTLLVATFVFYQKNLLTMLRYLFLAFSLLTASFLFAQSNKNISSNIYFLENKGQVLNSNGSANTNVLFTTQKQGVKMALTKTGITYQWQKNIGLPAANGKGTPFEPKVATPNAQVQTYRMDVELIGANPNALIEKHNPAPDFVNYYTVNNPNGISHVQHYQKVVYKNIYNGIDWVWYFNSNGIKYDFVVHPGADYKQIRLKVVGATKLALLENGGLALTSPMGQIEEDAPASFVNGEPVGSSFANTNGVISFNVAPYNKKAALIIDPTLSWSTYYGSTEEDYVFDMAVDKAGNTFLVGSTYGTAGISDSAGVQKQKGAQKDGFLVKFDAEGNRAWATYYGTKYDDQLLSVTTDDSLNVIVCGNTQLGDSLATTGSYQFTTGGYYDAILVKFNTAGLRTWATYYGGSDYEEATAITCDNFGNIYMAGTTYSSDKIAYNGFINTFCSNITSAFLVKFNPSGARDWSTYYCGTGGNTEATSVAVDKASNVYLAGNTKAQTNIGYNGLNTSYGGGNSDAYLAKFTTNGSRIWGTYYGGAKNDYGYGVAVDAATNVYLTGYTNSTQNIAYNGYKNNLSDTDDVYLVKLDSAGVRLWATYYGGKESDRAYDICINKDTNVFIAGTTYSDTDIAVGGYQNTYGWIADGFFTMFNKNGVLQWGSYYGENDNDNCVAIATQGDGILYIAGTTESHGMGNYGYLDYRAGKVDGFLAQFFFKGLPYSPFITGFKSCDTGQLMLIARKPRGLFSVAWYTDSVGGAPFYAKDTLLMSFTQTDTLWVSTTYNSTTTSKRFPVVARVTKRPQARFAVNDSVMCFNTNNFLFKDSSTYYADPKNYEWDFDNDSTLSGTKTATLSYQKPGIYNVSLTVTDSANCSSTIIRKIYVGEEPTAGFYVNKDTQCFSGNFYEFIDTSSIAGGTGLSYTWNFGNAATPATIKDAKFAFTTPGIVNVKHIITSIYGCKDSAFTTVNILESPISDFTINADTQCFATQSFIITNNSYLPSNGTPTIVWDFGDSTYDSTATPMHAFVKSGTYKIRLSITDSSKTCTSVLEKQVLLIPQPRVGFWMFNDSLCLRNNVFALNDTSSISGGKIIHYKWSFGDSSANDTTRFPQHSYKNPGSYDIKLVAEPDLGCKDSVVKTVTVMPTPHASFSLSAPSVCQGTKVKFTSTSTADASDPLKNYSWDFGDVQSSNLPSPEHLYLQKGTYSFNLRVFTTFGCDDDTSLFLPVYANPVASYNAPASVCAKAPITFLSTSTISSGSIAEARWFFGNGDTIISISPSVDYKYPAQGTFNYTLVAISNNGCTDSATGSILILSQPSTTITGPATVLQNVATSYTSVANANWKYNWLVENGAIYANGTSQTAQILFPNTGTAKVKLFVVETITLCQSDTVEKTVSVGANGIGTINASLIKMYPNPATDNLFIECETAGTYTLTDMAGKQIANGTVGIGNTAINTQALAAGTYVLVFTDTNENTGVYKLLKK
jgi:PKD repeat protein